MHIIAYMRFNYTYYKHQHISLLFNISYSTNTQSDIVLNMIHKATYNAVYKFYNLTLSCVVHIIKKLDVFTNVLRSRLYAGYL